MEVILVSKNSCYECVYVKKQLESVRVNYRIIDIEDQEALRHNVNKVPALIFVGKNNHSTITGLVPNSKIIGEIEKMAK